MRVAVKAARSAHERRLVGGRDDDDRAGQALGAEVVLEELAHLAAALTDEGDDGDLRRRCRARSSTAAIDLPTPEPAKMPMRWPRPTVVSVSRARTPSGSGRDSMRRSGSGADGGSASTGTPALDGSGPRRRWGGPRPSSTRPSSSGPIGTWSARPGRRTGAPTRMPSIRRSACTTARRSPTATTSARLRSSPTCRRSPMAAETPRTRMPRPATAATAPIRSGRAAVSSTSRPGGR